MNSLLESEKEHQDQGGRNDREITLGTSTVLGTFFALAILCAVFFGFGYSLGSKHSTPQPGSQADSAIYKSFNSLKPAPGSLANPAGKPPANPYEAPPADVQKIPSTLPQKAGSTAFATDVSTARPPKTPPAVAPPTPVALPVAPGVPPSVVQIAAVSHQEDADAIATSLQRRGYNVAIRQEPQDKLLHIQVGPFAARKDAEAMRQRLLGDGFNAYIK